MCWRSAEKDAVIAALQAQIEELRSQLAEMQRLVVQRDEIARLKG